MAKKKARLEKARSLYTIVVEAMTKGDDEVAHAREDDLHLYALKCVRDSVPGYRGIVAIALQTEILAFNRWCA